MSSALRKGSLARPAAYLALLGAALMVACGIAGLLGATAGGIAFGSFSPTLIASLFLGGAAAAAVATFSLKRVRIAWAFAVSLHATLAVALLLAGPVLHGIGVPGALALAPATYCGLIAALFAMAAADY
jgi:hypothetical protein